VCGDFETLFAVICGNQAKTPQIKRSGDHYAIVVTMQTGLLAEQKHYLEGRRRMPKTAERGSGETKLPADVAFEQRLKCKVQVEPKKQSVHPDWLSAMTHALLDKRVNLLKHGASHRRRKQVGHHIRKSMRRDWRSRAEEAGRQIEQLLEAKEVSGAFDVAKRWYRKSTGRPPPPCRENMEATASRYKDLYQAEPAPGAPIPTPTSRQWQVLDDAPEADKIAWHVRKLKTKKAPGTSGICPEDMRHWLNLFEENRDQQPFRLLTEIVQSAFLMGQLPQALSVAILVLLPKPGSTDFRGIGLLESVWKLILSILDARMKDIVEFNNAIHGFRQERGTGTAVLHNKLGIQLAIRRKDTVVQLYLDLTKAYNTLDRGCALAILRDFTRL
jgi:hypothetical protein